MSDFRRRSVFTVVDLATDITTVRTGNAILLGIYVNTVLSTHACPIEETSGGAVITLPADLAAGSQLAWAGLPMDGLVVDPDNAATGNITIEWAPILN